MSKGVRCMQDDATMKELLLAVRADEANHSHVNHTFAGIHPDEKNPFISHRTH